MLGVWGEVGVQALFRGWGNNRHPPGWGAVGVCGCAGEWGGGASFWLQEAVEPVLACLTAHLSSPCLCLSVSLSLSHVHANANAFKMYLFLCLRLGWGSHYSRYDTISIFCRR